MYDLDLHVLWTMKGPGLPVGKRVRGQVRTLDFTPTALDLMGATTVQQFNGEGVWIRREEQEQMLEKFDTVIICAGMTPAEGPSPEVKEKVEKIEEIINTLKLETDRNKLLAMISKNTIHLNQLLGTLQTRVEDYIETEQYKRAYLKVSKKNKTAATSQTVITFNCL